MVKKTVLYFLAILLVLITAGLSWMFYTAKGAEFALAGVSKLTPVTVEASAARGRLADSIFFRELHIRYDDLTVSARDVSLVWQPGMLFRRSLQIQEIGLRALLITDNGETRDADADIVETLKVVKGGLGRLSWLKAEVSQVSAKHISYVSQQTEGFAADHVSLRLCFKNELLQIYDIVFESSLFDASGAVRFSAAACLPDLDIRLIPAEPVSGFEHLHLLLAAEQAPCLFRLSLNAASDEQTVLLTSRLRYDGDDTVEIQGLQVSESPGESRMSLIGKLRFAADFSKLEASVTSLEIKTGPPYPAADILGHLVLALQPDGVKGSYMLENRSNDALEALKLNGRFEADSRKAVIDIDKGYWLGGEANGRVEIDMGEAYLITAALALNAVDPSAARQGLDGHINLHLEGFLQLSADAPVVSGFEGVFIDSLFLDRKFAGGVDIAVAGPAITINRLELQGQGFDMTAQGVLDDGVGCSVHVADMGALLPGASGQFRANGTVRYFQETLTGQVQAEAADLKVFGVEAVSATLSAYRKAEDGLPMGLTAEISGVEYDGRGINTVTLTADGLAADHRIDIFLEHELLTFSTRLSGAFARDAWQGHIQELMVAEKAFSTWRLPQAAALSVGRDGFALASFTMSSDKNEIVSIHGDGQWDPLRLNLEAHWDRIALSRTAHFFDDMAVNGILCGRADIISRDRDAPYIRVQTQAQASVEHRETAFAVERSTLEASLEWTGNGLESRLDVHMDDAVAVRGRFVSDEPSTLALPATGRAEVWWEVPDVTYFADMLPKHIIIDGQATGSIVSGILPGMTLDLTGSVRIDEGALKIIQKNGIISSTIHRAEAAFFWKEDRLSGTCLVTLEDYGTIEAVATLPIQAASPFEVYRHRDLTISLRADVREQGLLSYVFPDIVQESSGKVDVEIRVDGSVETPSIRGTVAVADLQGYLPQTGIDISAGMRAEFKGNEIVLDTVSLCSGSGCIQGRGKIYLEGTHLTNIDVRLTGERFQAVYLPELQVFISPDLRVEGSSEHLKIRGDIALPSVLFAGGDTKSVIRPSADVVIMDVQEAEIPEPVFLTDSLDIEINIGLGDDVRINAQGLDARLTGAVTLRAREQQGITAKGEIRVAEGSYSGGGTRLNITRGSVVFDDDPLDEPALNVLALRSIGDVRAGVQITGRARDPVVRLYSEPSMSDTDILGYIVLGRPIGQDSGQFSMLMVAASSLLSRGEVLSLQEGIRKKFRLDVIDIEPGDTEMEGSALTIGKYLNPDIYVSIGYSVFTGSSMARIRYSLTQKWQVESSIGQESGADLFYRIELK